MRYFSRSEVERIGLAGCYAWENPKNFSGIAYRYLSKFWLFVEENDTAFTPHALTGFWEAWITRWISEQLDNHSVFYDIGANVGYYSLMAATSGLYTVAVEPISELCELIHKSSRLNNVNIEICNVALSNFNGTANFTVVPGHSGGSHLSLSDEDSHRNVPVFTFDSYFKDINKDILVKIDAEGAEPLIWDGMRRIWERKNCTVALEWAGGRYDSYQFAQDLWANGKNMLSYIDFEGFEQPYKSWKELAETQNLMMVVVRKR